MPSLLAYRSRLLLAGVLLVGTLARLSCMLWQEPWVPHHPDENILGQEALGLWEGITPREIGWPASTTRLAISAIAAVEWSSQNASTAWALRAQPDKALQSITDWIGQRLIDPGPLLRIGRFVSLVTGILYLASLAWTLRQWAGHKGQLAALLGGALAPLAVAYSQFVLADVAGLFFATVMLGLAAQPDERRIVAMGAVGGLAAASKFHFGIWLLAVPIAAAAWREADPARSARVALLAMAVALFTIVALVPWLWLNPLLAMKEIAGVVVSKMVGGRGVTSVVSNLVLILEGLGAVTLTGALLGVLAARKIADRAWLLAAIVPAAGALAAFALAGTVFDRYGLVLLPGLAVLSGAGWQRALDGKRSVRLAASMLLAVTTLATAASLLMNQRKEGALPPDSQVRAWILEHIDRGRRIAIPHESAILLPRTREQLRACAEYVQTPAAYAEKWRVEGFEPSSGDAQPMRSTVLADEAFHAWVCRRQLDAQTDEGFDVVAYHPDPRFGAVLQHQIFAQAASGHSELAGRIDVLVSNFRPALDLEPAHIVSAQRGARFVYVRRSPPGAERP